MSPYVTYHGIERVVNVCRFIKTSLKHSSNKKMLRHTAKKAFEARKTRIYIYYLYRLNMFEQIVKFHHTNTLIHIRRPHKNGGVVAGHIYAFVE